MPRRVTRRQVIMGGALSLAAVTIAGGRPAAAQIEGAPTFIMFHVEAGW
jgi:hypothetical protein